MKDISIKKLLNDYIKDEAIKMQDKKNTSFHISDSGKCHRMRIMKRANYEVLEYDLRTLGLFLNGTILHQFIQQAISKTLKDKIIVLTEGRVESIDKNFTGYYDLLCFDFERNDFLLIDIKTVQSGKLIYASKQGVDKFYAMQVGNYYFLLQDKLKKDFRDGRVLYVSRDDFLLEELAVPLTDEFLIMCQDDNIKLLEEWELFGKTEELPDKIDEKSPVLWQCGYCSYASYCERGKDWVKQIKNKKKEEK